MSEAQEVLQLPIDQFLGQEAKGENSVETNVSNTSFPSRRNFNWWIRIAIFSLFLLAGQSVATVLGRLYYNKGGNSKWMVGLALGVGFPILIPLYLLSPTEKPTANNNLHGEPPSVLILASVYISVGILQSAASMMYSFGYLYLPVSTYSLICASQLGFNAFFSFFLNALKFTPFIINSLLLLTISSTLLVFQDDDSAESTDIDKGKYAIGFVCTLAGSAVYGLMLSLTQFFIERIIKKETLKVILRMIIYPSCVSTCIIFVGLFASGEWKNLNTEMEEFKTGEVSYVMTLIWLAICWQIFSIGAVGLISEVSSVFSTVISTLGVPIVPVLAVLIFQDKMNGLKAISMILAIWGFVSYVYQNYLDDGKSKIDEDRSRIRRMNEEQNFGRSSMENIETN